MAAILQVFAIGFACWGLWFAWFFCASVHVLKAMAAGEGRIGFSSREVSKFATNTLCSLQMLHIEHVAYGFHTISITERGCRVLRRCTFGGITATVPEPFHATGC